MRLTMFPGTSQKFGQPLQGIGRRSRCGSASTKQYWRSSHFDLVFVSQRMISTSPMIALRYFYVRWHLRMGRQLLISARAASSYGRLIVLDAWIATVPLILDFHDRFSISLPA